MKIFSLIILFLLGCLLPISLSANSNSRKKRELIFRFNYQNFPAFLYKAVKILDDIYDAWNYLLENPNEDITSALFRSKEHRLLGRFLKISSKLDNMEEEVRQAADSTIITILQAFPKILKLELNLHELTLIINQVNFVDDQMRQYLISGFENITSEETLIPIPSANFELLSNESGSLLYESNYRDKEISNRIMKRDTNPKWLIERYTLEDFAAWATGHNYNSLQSLLRRMNDLVKPRDSHTIFEMINEISQVRLSTLCKTQTPETNQKTIPKSAQLYFEKKNENWKYFPVSSFERKRLSRKMRSVSSLETPLISMIGVFSTKIPSFVTSPKSMTVQVVLAQRKNAFI